ncbi:MAG: hypothetical protein HXX19_00605 [Rhodoferax sp.]|nr:hypothetical protein [Rhodoferax sp.]
MFRPWISLCCVLALALAAPAQAQTDANPAAAATGFSLKLDVINPEDLLDSNRTLVIPTLYVSVLTDGSIAASKRSGLFSSSNNVAKASASYKVTGFDKAYVQQLAQAAYEDLVDQLRKAGYTVLTYDDVKDRDFVKAAARQTSVGAMGLPTKSEGPNNFVYAAPSDEQVFKSGFGGGDLAEFQSGGKSRFTDATLIVPTYTFVSPQSWGEGSSGYKSVSAEVNVAEGMNMQSARATWMGQPRVRIMTGIPGVATKFALQNVTEKSGALTKMADTTPQAANALSSVLNMLGGGGVIKSNSSEWQLAIDRDAYRAGVLNGVRAFNAEVAKAAAAAAPKN